MQAEIAAARFGFGGRGAWPAPALHAQLPDDAPDGYPRIATLDALAATDRFRDARRARNRNEPGADEAFVAARAAWQSEVENAARLALARAVDARTRGAGADFRERLVWFWADHFTVGVGRRFDHLLVPAFIDDAIRPHVTGRFAQLLRAAVLHPAMLQYLDQTASVGPNSRAGLRRAVGLNENLARELLELHTLGAGAGYTQRDVRELAELLTGLSVTSAAGTIFDPRLAEPGTETVLGRTWGGDPPVLEHVEAFLDALARRPEVPAHIARKLVVHFVSDTPDPALVARLAAIWRDTDGDLRAVSAALASDPVAAQAPPAKVRRPFELLVAGFRALGIDGQAVMNLSRRDLRRHVLDPLARMGQDWMAPPGPNGWPEEAEAWITPARLAARIAWAMTAPAALAGDLPDPRDFARDALGAQAAGVLAAAVRGAENRAEGVGLVLASPAFNRR